MPCSRKPIYYRTSRFRAVVWHSGRVYLPNSWTHVWYFVCYFPAAEFWEQVYAGRLTVIDPKDIPYPIPEFKPQ